MTPSSQGSGAPAPCTLLVVGIGELATPRGSEPLGGAGLARVHHAKGQAVACDGERILAVGPEGAPRRPAAAEILDASGGLVIPGLVDAHTHPVFLGTREGEFSSASRGVPRGDRRCGRWDRSSLRGVRGADEAALVAALLPRLDRFLALGTTTIEAKTGYGLTVADELKGLDVIANADRHHAVDLVATCLGPGVPPEFEGASEWVRSANELWPAAAPKATFADVFTESHVFGIKDSRRLMESARDAGLSCACTWIS